MADDAFPLKENIQKPLGQAGLTHDTRIYNYRLSRARRVVENSFGILANRFRVFMTPISLDPAKVENIVIACCCLHNFSALSTNQHMLLDVLLMKKTLRQIVLVQAIGDKSLSPKGCFHLRSKETTGHQAMLEVSANISLILQFTQRQCFMAI